MNSKINRHYVSEQSTYYEQIMKFIDEVKQQQIEIHTLTIYQNESIIFEAAKQPYDIDLPHQSFSMAKGFIATAIGFLYDEQKILLENQLIDYFPEYSYVTNFNGMTVRDALMMATGHCKPMFGTEFRALEKDWLLSFLHIPFDKKPGEQFLYNSGTSFLLAALIEKIVGMTVREYLVDKLFIPMQMEMPSWEQSPEGSSTGGWGLYIKAEDMLKMGILYLNKGIWKGKRLLSEYWVQEATTLKIAIDESLSSFSTRGYGYHFWCGDDGVYRADGAFGQLCIVDPKTKAVIVINGGTPYLQQLRQLSYKLLLPGLKEKRLEDKSDAQEAMPVVNPYPSLRMWSYLHEDVPHKKDIIMQINAKYDIVSSLLPTQKESFTAVSMRIDEHIGEIVFVNSKGEHRLAFGIQHYVETKTTFTTLLHDNYVWDETVVSTVGYWENNTQLHIVCRYLDKVYVDRFSIKFDECNLMIRRSVNVNSLPQKEEEIHAIKRM